MKATLEFNLPEEEREHLDAVNGTKWKILLSDFDQTLRRYLKHGHNFDNVEDCLSKLRAELHQDIQVEGLSFE
jgi:hypothetical protein